ncbi:MAG: ShlB/FhaC/HecB family hemolysin secretion/activation protein [Candidatus Omnitrophota bacterium]
MKNIKFVLGLIFAMSLAYPQSYAANPPPSQQMGGMERTRELEAKSKKLTAEIQQKKKKPSIEEKLPAEAPPVLSGEKILIKHIVVTGATILTEKEIRDIVAPFENKELPLSEMQKAADLISEAYRTQGYITSRAYLAPQKIENEKLEIKVIEGKMGDLDVTGNRYYKASLYKKKIDLTKGENFDYNKLAKGLRKINEQPDRTAKAVLVPGKEPGATDVALEAKDNLPVHAGFTYDNYGSRYILRNRYQFNASDNNLLGFEDIFQFLYQFAEGGAYSLIGGNYVIPVTRKLKVGCSAFWSKLHLLNDYKSLDVKGNSALYSLFATQSIIDTEKVSVNLNAGFDVKDIFNYQQGTKTSYDKMRVAKIGVDADLSDRFGRSIFTNGIEVGIPGFMGGLKAKDPHASAVGSGGAFTKYVMNLYRLQPMPFGSMILCKNQLQVSNRPLTSTEQFQVGGIVNARGYAPAEITGDIGFSTTTEWSFPVYGLPKNWKVPATKINFYDATKLVAFYDYGNARYLKSAAGTREKFDQLQDLGWGVRFNLANYLTVKADFAYPISAGAAGGHTQQRAWVSVAVNY